MDGLSFPDDMQPAAPSSMMVDIETILRLSSMDVLAYGRCRKAEAAKLGISVILLDREIQIQRRAKQRDSAAATGKAWIRECQVTQQGELRGNVTNALAPLRADPRVSHIVRYDEMQRLTILMQPLPRQQLDGSVEFEPRPICDHDYTAIQEWVQREGLEAVSQNVMRQAIDKRARELCFHPVRDWLGTLEWDGKARVGNWLTQYLGVAETPYSNGIGAYFLVGMVARVRQPGCKADYMLVLEGRQGARKSTACAILGGDYFSDAMPDIRSGKDASQHLNGKWLIEVAEMSALDKAEAAALKAFITRRVEKYRPSYGHAEVVEHRQCLFIGTTNKTTYLRDETGGRRFWPVVVGEIETDALARDRDQLFAEADYLFAQGAPWWPDAAFEAQHIKGEQDARYEADSWEDTIGDWLDRLHDEPETVLGVENAVARCTVMTVAIKALHMETQKVGTHEQRRIKAALERLGWEQGKRLTAGRFYTPGLAATARQKDRKAQTKAPDLYDA